MTKKANVLLKKILFFILGTPSLIFLFIFGFFSYSAAQNVIAEFKDMPSYLGLTESITIHFTEAITTENFRESLRITPKTNVFVSWEKNNTLVIKPKSIWKPEMDYTITLPEGKTKFMSTFPGKTLSFKTIPYPKVEEVWPENNATDVVVGIEDPLSVKLDRGAGDFWIDFSLNPKRQVIYQSNDNRSRFEILPKETFESGVPYTVDVVAYPIDFPNEEYQKKITTFSFTTLPPRPSTWSLNLNDRLSEVRKYTNPKVLEGKYIDINISAQIMTLFENGSFVDSYLISSGKRGMDTPKGTFAIHNQFPRPWSKQYSLFMPHWMAITPDGKYGIHELPEWPGGYKEGANHLGIPVSHGCVRLGVGPAQKVYEWSYIGMPVIIY
ncbi:MAG: L,D-transpeptidase family protein [Candidatus Moraniibacteriota bacterium]|nr:MAG: L,D-transpeptidase family protein [Candidatus Moranbacteria bacterium]